MKFAVFTTGYKGYKFLEGLEHTPAFVVSYDNKERQDKLHYKGIIEWCQTNNVVLYTKKQFKIDRLQNKLQELDKIFVIGWQFLIKDNLEKIVVFHDSFLPERRGFAPTISALLDKSEYLGASCFKPENSLIVGPDYGKIYYRIKKQICYPIKLKEAFDHVVILYLEMAHNILREETIPKAINYDKSTFSVWRDKEDLRIDWTMNTAAIQQKIFSLGYPYMGATSIYNNIIIHIKEAEKACDMNFVNRNDHCGKIWKIEGNCPYIVCSDGMIKITKATDIDNNEIIFDKIRKRLK